MKWITLIKFAGSSGYTRKACYTKIERGVWKCGLHWRKAPDGRLFINSKEIENWVEGSPV